jgi:hypothetical protein
MHLGHKLLAPMGFKVQGNKGLGSCKHSPANRHGALIGTYRSLSKQIALIGCASLALMQRQAFYWLHASKWVLVFSSCVGSKNITLAAVAQWSPT